MTSYIIERRNVNKQTWIRVSMVNFRRKKSSLFYGVSKFQVGETDAQTLNIRASKLTEKNVYEFRVRAENKIGESPNCVSLPATAKLPFGIYKFPLSAGKYWFLNI